MGTCSGHRGIVRGGISVELRHVSVSESVSGGVCILQWYYIQESRYNQQIILTRHFRNEPITRFLPATRQDNTDTSLGW